MFTTTIDVKELLTKLGEAIYMHKEMIKTAEKAKSAVDYLASKGVFSSNTK